MPQLVVQKHKDVRKGKDTLDGEGVEDLVTVSLHATASSTSTPPIINNSYRHSKKCPC